MKQPVAFIKIVDEATRVLDIGYGHVAQCGAGAVMKRREPNLVSLGKQRPITSRAVWWVVGVLLLVLPSSTQAFGACLGLCTEYVEWFDDIVLETRGTDGAAIASSSARRSKHLSHEWHTRNTFTSTGLILLGLHVCQAGIPHSEDANLNGCGAHLLC